MATASATNYVTKSEACRITGISAKSIIRVCTVNNVRMRSFAGLKGTKFHKGDLLRLLSAADAAAEVGTEARA